MKTLVIHPLDHTTRFLSKIYEGKDWTIIRNNQAKKGTLRQQIAIHDRVIFLGHGTEFGLIAPTYGPRYIINSNYVYALRNKECVYIWCNANVFFDKFRLQGFNTGMIISEYDEALHYCVGATDKEILESNILFAEIVAKYLFSDNIVEKIKQEYNSDTNNVIIFNRQNLFYGSGN